jgi:hypothetical protein
VRVSLGTAQNGRATSPAGYVATASADLSLGWLKSPGFAGPQATSSLGDTENRTRGRPVIGLDRRHQHAGRFQDDLLSSNETAATRDPSARCGRREKEGRFPEFGRARIDATSLTRSSFCPDVALNARLTRQQGGDL